MQLYDQQKQSFLGKFTKNGIQRKRQRQSIQNVRDDTKNVSSEDKKWLFTILKMKFNKVL